MTKIIATDEIVFAAADALVTEGTDPTVLLLRERVGGSYSTVSKALKRWEKQRSEALRSPPPDRIASQGQAFVQSLWSAAQTLADEAAQDAKRQAADSVRVAEVALAGAEDQIRKLEVEGELLQQRLEHANALAEREQNHSDEQRRQLKRAEAELDQLNSELQDARSHAQSHLVRTAALEAERDALRDQLAELLKSVRGQDRGREPVHRRPRDR